MQTEVARALGWACVSSMPADGRGQEWDFTPQLLVLALCVGSGACHVGSSPPPGTLDAVRVAVGGGGEPLGTRVPDAPSGSAHNAGAAAGTWVPASSVPHPCTVTCQRGPDRPSGMTAAVSLQIVSPGHLAAACGPRQ